MGTHKSSVGFPANKLLLEGNFEECFVAVKSVKDAIKHADGALEFLKNYRCDAQSRENIFTSTGHRSGIANIWISNNKSKSIWSEN